MTEQINQKNSVSPSEHEVPDYVEKLRSGHPILFKPRASDGTVVMVDPVSRPIHPGEVVLAFHPAANQQVILHRVVKIHGNQVWLWGDHERQGEGPFLLDAIIGVARIKPVVGWAAWRLVLRRLWLSFLRWFR